MTTATSEYVDVAVVNNEGHEIGFRFPDTDEGRSLILTLQRRARREELRSVEVGKTVKGPKYDPAVTPERRRGRPVEGQVEAVAPVAVSDDPSDHDADKLASAEADAKEKLAEAEAAGETVATEPGGATKKARSKKK